MAETVQAQNEGKSSIFVAGATQVIIQHSNALFLDIHEFDDLPDDGDSDEEIDDDHEADEVDDDQSSSHRNSAPSPFQSPTAACSSSSSAAAPTSSASAAASAAAPSSIGDTDPDSSDASLIYPMGEKESKQSVRQSTLIRTSPVIVCHDRSVHFQQSEYSGGLVYTLFVDRLPVYKWVYFVGDGTTLKHMLTYVDKLPHAPVWSRQSIIDLPPFGTDGESLCLVQLQLVSVVGLLHTEKELSIAVVCFIYQLLGPRVFALHGWMSAPAITLCLKGSRLRKTVQTACSIGRASFQQFNHYVLHKSARFLKKCCKTCRVLLQTLRWMGEAMTDSAEEEAKEVNLNPKQRTDRQLKSFCHDNIGSVFK